MSTAAAGAPSRRERTARLLWRLYKNTLSPVFQASAVGHCKHLPTCSEYALVAVTRHGWLRGSWLAARRVARCNPWSPGGFDPVP